jgi:hypothetical protein
VALDASKGRLWFAKDGVWLGGGLPDEDLHPAVQLKKKDFQYILPVIGVLPGCTKTVEIRAIFGPPFKQERPASFIPMRSDECSCTAGYVACMSRVGTLVFSLGYVACIGLGYVACMSRVGTLVFSV